MKPTRYSIKVQFSLGTARGEVVYVTEIFTVAAASAEAAMSKIEALARKEEHSYLNSDQTLVFFKYRGMLDGMNLNLCGPKSVWYDVQKAPAPRCKSASKILERLA